MKRTKDRFGKFEYYNDHNISSLKVFDGEDLEYQDRMKYQTMQQNAWIQQQKYENEMKRQHEREEERRYAEQTLAINRMRSMLESEHEQKIKDMNCMQKDYNIKLADFKREKEAKEKKDEEELDLYNVQDAEDTRNRAYHFMKDTIEKMKRTKDRFGKFEYYNDHNISSLKVFDGEDLEYQDRMKYQTMQQNAWIQQQKYENEMKRKHEREEERRYAEQTLAINRMRSMLESEHEQKIKDMNCMQKDYNIKLADFKREKEAKEKKDEEELDLYNVQDAEDTRNRAYNFMKDTIEKMKETI
jgi:hypothetical protein